MLKTVFCLMGPTASGKTALACELLPHYPFEIISVDSAMIYREMDIGTAKPTKKELAAAPHHLLDILDPPQSFSAAQFCSEASRLCEDIFNRGKIPLLTGGTMMYFQAFQQGLSSLPDADESIRAKIIEQAELLGWEKMHAELALIDSVTAKRVHANDTQRISRALEVFYITGKPLTTFLAEQKTKSPYNFVNLALFPENRAWLHERIALRFDQMLHDGFIHEVEQLLKKWDLPSTCPAMRCVGYRQAIDYLHNQNDYQDFRDKGIAATRQLAKRQLTWLRHWPNAYLFTGNHEETLPEIMAIINKMMDNSQPD